MANGMPQLLPVEVHGLIKVRIYYHYVLYIYRLL